MAILRRRKMSGAFVGSLAGLGAGLLATPIMMDEFTVLFWLALGLALGGSLGFIRDLFAAKPSRKVGGTDG
jgi:hypothetical protein